MKQRQHGYQLLRDPVWWTAIVLYGLHRLLAPWIRPWEPSFITFHFRDFLMIPALLPALLAVESYLGLRPKLTPPSGTEIWLHLILWSLICEFTGPFAFGMGVADPWDVVAYASGALVAWLFWHLRYNRSVTSRKSKPVTS